MDCIVCGREAGFNRVVVDHLSGVELGGFCRRCESVEFGNALRRGLGGATEGCVLCRRDGHFALAQWEPRSRREGPEVVCYAEYDVSESTPELCDEHLHALREGEDADAPAADAGDPERGPR